MGINVILVNMPQKAGRNAILANMQRKVDISGILARNSLFSSQFPTHFHAVGFPTFVPPIALNLSKLTSTHTFYPSCAEFILFPVFQKKGKRKNSYYSHLVANGGDPFS